MTSFSELWNGWKNAGDPTPFLLIDCAGFAAGAEALPREACSELECLFTGDLADELANVAPYLGRLQSFDDSVRNTVEELLRSHVAVVVVLDRYAAEEITFSMLHRHFRKHNVVYGPEGEPLFFRYYDPRVLPSVLEVMEPAQLSVFFGPVTRIFLNRLDDELVEFQSYAGRGSTPSA